MPLIRFFLVYKIKAEQASPFKASDHKRAPRHAPVVLMLCFGFEHLLYKVPCRFEIG